MATTTTMACLHNLLAKFSYKVVCIAAAEVVVIVVAIVVSIVVAVCCCYVLLLLLSVVVSMLLQKVACNKSYQPNIFGMQQRLQLIVSYKNARNQVRKLTRQIGFHQVEIEVFIANKKLL